MLLANWLPCGSDARERPRATNPTNRGHMDTSESNRQHVNGETPDKRQTPSLRSLVEMADQLRRVDEELIERVRERPLVAVGIALAAGYVIGRIFSRWG